MSKRITSNEIKQNLSTSENLLPSLENQWVEKVRSGDAAACEIGLFLTEAAKWITETASLKDK